MSSGRMLTRTDASGTTTFVWSGMDCVQETDHSGNVTRYYKANGGLSSFDRTVGGTTTTYQLHSDGPSSIRKVTDSSGTVQATYDYGRLGQRAGVDFRFDTERRAAVSVCRADGVRWDAATGLYYMRQRWYDPALVQVYLS